MSAPTELRIEHLDDALGITYPTPRLSWRLPAGAYVQTAYQVELDGVALPGTLSARSVLVPWAGAPLRSRQRAICRVKVWTDTGESDWSAPTMVEAGLLDPTDWRASWIEPVEDERPPDGERPAYVLRHEFDLDELGTARLYATAHGVYETFLNGARVGDLELTPGFTSYHRILQVQAYDVTDLLRAGRNTWETVLSDGWYRGRTIFTQVADAYGDTTAFRGQLHVGGAVVATGPGWSSATGPIFAADLMAGQAVDLRRETAGWRPVRIVEHDVARLVSSPAPPIRRVEEVRPVAVRRLASDRQVVDLGQNINGWVRLHNVGPNGTTITLTHGEAVDDAGDVTQEHLNGVDFVRGRPLSVGMIDHVTSAGRAGDSFEPRHTAHGFQFVRIEGHPARLTPDDVTGVVVHTDLRRTGWFRCSDERINRFHDMTVWSFRDNACDIPTDCPHRERAGWTGDFQVFFPTAAFLFDVAGFSTKWLRDLMADARDDGCVCSVAPDPYRAREAPDADNMWTRFRGSAGWGDAITIVPLELWRSYADDGLLAECWPAMVAWVDFAAKSARERRHPDRVERSTTPAPHEAFLWDGTFHWGEWLEPGDGEGTAEEVLWQMFERDKGDVGTAFLHRSALLAARAGRLIGHHTTADRFEELAANALDAWRAEFIGADGTLTPDTQANHVRALGFGLVPDELRARTAARLVELIRAADTHVATGFLATPYLLPMLADTGYLDVAYELLLQDTPPSWLYMADRGATTVWEMWDGLAEDGTPKHSLNHYSKGAVISFLHTHTAGIQLVDDEPGYRRFRIAPRPGGGLSWAEAVHDCPYGRIESSWRRSDDHVELTVTVPPGTSAEVVLPDGFATTAKPGTSTYRCTLDGSESGR